MHPDLHTLQNLSVRTILAMLSWIDGKCCTGMENEGGSKMHAGMINAGVEISE